MNDIYQLTYVSKNLIQGSDVDVSDAIAKILEVSRHKNTLVNITGALMFTGRAFAQVLEGERCYIDSTFNAIKKDCKHCQIDLLQYEITRKRSFSSWSMAFIDQSRHGNITWESLGEKSGFDVLDLDKAKIFPLMYRIVQMREDAWSEHHDFQSLAIH